MYRFFLFLFSFLVLLSACGPSPEEIKVRKQLVADSIHAVQKRNQEIADSIKLTQEQQRVHQEKMEVGKSVRRSKLSNLLDQITKSLEKERNKLAQINEFQIGRSLTTKQQQLQDQTKKINELQLFKTNLEKAISNTYLHQPLPEQTSPEGTIRQLFLCAKKDDLTPLKYLLDPYGDFDGDAFALCLIEVYPQEAQQEWLANFENGRIMGEAVVKGQTATIEIAFGPSSNKLGTINLVKRMDYWYIQSF